MCCTSALVSACVSLAGYSVVLDGDRFLLDGAAPLDSGMPDASTEDAGPRPDAEPK